ncbi:hypothetical protein [Tahibacter caeni]|uniref:hypothetical protein n=1 Tax=Tahibacter caeni TaxID=1453545 RepID=UPI00214767DC|nr:hypothetical protein [Tahibacter caeni]
MPALLVLIVLIYLPGLAGGYAFDDFPNIVNNVTLHVTTLNWADWSAAAFSSPASDLQRPLTMLTFAANHVLFGLDPWWMKAGNLLLHLLNTVLVFAIVRRVIGLLAPQQDARLPALWTAAAWGLAPINVMAVLFVVQRMESLCHLFVFGGLLLYLIGRQRLRAGRGGIALPVFALAGGAAAGLLAKESAALLPLYAASADLVLFGLRRADGRIDRRIAAVFVALLVIPAVAGAFWLLPKMLNPSVWATRDFTLTERLLSEARIVLDYLRWTVVPEPSQLSLYHDDYPISRGLLQPPATLPAVIGIGALAAASLALIRRRPLTALGLQWFLGAQLITATVIPLELMFEHRNYFASLGALLVLADLLLIAPSGRTARRAGVGLALVLLVFGAAVTHMRAREWSDPLRFAVSEAAKHPQSPRAQFALAYALMAVRMRAPETISAERVLDALERARAAPGGSILAEQGSIIFAMREKRPVDPQWWQQMRAKLERRAAGPQDVAALGALTDCAVENVCELPPAEMVAVFATALSHGPQANLLSVYANYVLNELNDATLALGLMQEAIELAPREPQHRENFARLLIALGRYGEAQRQIDALRRLGRFDQYRGKADLLVQRLEARRAEDSPPQ